LTVQQDLVDQLRDERVLVDRIRLDLAPGCWSLAWHGPPPRLRGRLRAVARTGLLAVADAGGVERAPDNLVADTGEVLHPAAADKDDRVLLEVVPDAGDVGGDQIGRASCRERG